MEKNCGDGGYEIYGNGNLIAEGSFIDGFETSIQIGSYD